MESIKMSFDLHITTVNELESFLDIVRPKEDNKLIKELNQELKDESTKLDKTIVDNSNQENKDA